MKSATLIEKDGYVLLRKQSRPKGTVNYYVLSKTGKNRNVQVLQVRDAEKLGLTTSGVFNELVRQMQKPIAEQIKQKNEELSELRKELMRLENLKII